MVSRNGIFATLGGAIYLSCGLIALWASSLLGDVVTLSTTQFLEMWSETILLLLFGFLLIISAFLVDSHDDIKQIVGFGMGTLASLIGVIIGFALLNFNTGLYSSQSGFGLVAATSQQLSSAMSFFTLGVLITAFFGFPLALVGSLRMFHEEEGDEGVIVTN